MSTLKDLEKKLKELDELKRKVEKLYSLNDIGGEIRKELEDEIKEDKEVEQYKKLIENKVNIPHLDKVLGKKAFRLKKTKKRTPITKEEIELAYEKSVSAHQAARRLGVSYVHFKSKAKEYGIFRTPGVGVSTKGKKRSPINPYKGKYPINEVLACKYPGFPAHRLKDKLIRSGLKKCECEICGYKDRRITDGKIPLLLNFEDGDNTNHRIDNLIIMCYNCTFTCGKGYISRGPTSFETFDPDILQDSKKVQVQRF